MYCPRCAVHNLDDAKFCRACGADISFVRQALEGKLRAAALDRPATGEAAKQEEKKKRAPATVDEGLKNIFTGVGLFIIFLIGIFVFRGAFWLTIWFIIPALASVGEGIGQLIRAQQEQARLLAATPSAGEHFSPAPIVRELSSPDTTEIVRAPASVTDGTTRHLDAPSKTS
ncbi:MAG TPA: zinc-ribbon domain-containing protein [Pyrinomonadaceae bacterium]|nr:zinc-ribbon domain-containing protein [Pyrinomonadaceae bacterium]